MKLINIKNNKGFTLIELMVATSIFVVIMLGSMSSLFILLDAGKNSRALRFAMDNVNFAMESMTSAIRMGTNYYCVDTLNGISMDSHLEDSMDCLGGETFMAFVPQQTTSSRVGYRLTSRNDEGDTHTLQRCDINDCVDIVSPDVNIEQLKFYVRGSSDSDNTQASVYIVVKGSVIVKEVPVSFSIQTLASQRNF